MRKLHTKRKPPFDGLKTHELRVGMLVETNYGNRFVIKELPKGIWFKVFRFGKNYAYESKESLGDKDCQPYAAGHWNSTNWIKEAELGRKKCQSQS